MSEVLSYNHSNKINIGGLPGMMSNFHKRFPVLVYIGCATSVLLVIVVGVVSLYFSRRQARLETWSKYSFEVMAQLDKIDQLSNTIITEKVNVNLPDFEETHRKQLQELTYMVHGLYKMERSDAAQMRNAKQLEKTIADLINYWKLENSGISRKGKQVNDLGIYEKNKIAEVVALTRMIDRIEQSKLRERYLYNSMLRGRTEVAITTGTMLILVIVSLLIYFILKEFRIGVNAYQREKEINQLKSNFVSLASHEFRTPLSSILLSVSLIEKYQQNTDVIHVLKHTQRIRSMIHNLTSILEDFLSLEKLDAGKVKAKCEPFDLFLLCEEIKEDMQMMLKIGQQIIYQPTGLIRPVVLDAHLLRNTLINLISNAIKYGGEGIVIKLETHITDEKVMIRVSDNGVGITATDQRELFSPFYRVNHNGSVPGTGLGLNIVARYVGLMNGSLSFLSVPHEDTHFEMIYYA